MTSQLEITDIRTDDMKQCLMLIKSSVDKLAAEFYSSKQIEAWVNQYPSPEEFSRWQKRRKMLVAREGDTIVGFGQIQFDRNEIVGVHVLPSKARNGIGSLLVNSLEQAAIEAGLNHVVIQASLNAVSFYKACGYKAVKAIEFAFSNGVLAEALFMRKQLPLGS